MANPPLPIAVHVRGVDINDVIRLIRMNVEGEARVKLLARNACIFRSVHSLIGAKL